MWPLSQYALEDESSILTPALLVYPDIVAANIKATIRMANNDPNRWRPHIKTAKLPSVVRQLVDAGVTNLKCSTTLELVTACRAGAQDVLLAFAVMGANATRTLQIAGEYPEVRISVLIESADQAGTWRGTEVGVFLDLNPGMNRTGVPSDRLREGILLAKLLGPQFRGLHFYDGQMSGIAAHEREARAHAGYDDLMRIINQFTSEGIAVREVITSGTPAAPYAMSCEKFRNASFTHRISPGTVVYNDTTSLEQLPDLGLRPAVLVLSTVVSRPMATRVTCDAGHKSVSVDAGVPNCCVLGEPALIPMKPSEEHLPIDAGAAPGMPALGTKLYLLPHHVCPTVNNFDDALLVRNGKVQSIERVAARGHESPLALLRGAAADHLGIAVPNL